MAFIKQFLFYCERCTDKVVAMASRVPTTPLCEDCFKVLGEKPQNTEVCEFCGDYWQRKEDLMCVQCLHDTPAESPRPH
jgi:hypothetical protein